jgi:hypothetical protein
MLKSSSLCLYSSNFGTFWLKIEQFWPFEEIQNSVQHFRTPTKMAATAELNLT